MLEWFVGLWAGITLGFMGALVWVQGPSATSGHAAACQSQDGWWVAATYDKDGTPKMFACVDAAGYLLRVTDVR